MGKPDSPSSRPRSGPLIDDPAALGSKAAKGLVHGRNMEGHMMKAFPSGFEEPRDGGIGTQGFEELDVGRAGRKEEDLDLLRRYFLRGAIWPAQKGAPPVLPFVEVPHGDPYVVYVHGNPTVRRRARKAARRTLRARRPRSRPRSPPPGRL